MRKFFAALVLFSILVATARAQSLVQAPLPRAYGNLIKYHPIMRYPPVAVAAKFAGTGIYRICFNPAGKVSRVDIVQSSGYKILDDRSVAVLRLWEAYPGKITRATIPITYTE